MIECCGESVRREKYKHVAGLNSYNRRAAAAHFTWEWRYQGRRAVARARQESSPVVVVVVSLLVHSFTQTQ